VPIGQADLFGRQIQTRRRHAQPPLDIGQRLAPRQLGMLGRNPARQHRLGERRAIIGQIGFLANQSQGSGEALGAQGFRRAESGERGAHDHDTPALFESCFAVMATHAAPLFSWGQLPPATRRR
jgi:hypothetical protein